MKITKDFDMDFFNKLPEEITVDILSRVPSESVLHCKLVCRNLRNIVSKDPSFPHKHLYHPSAAAAEDSCKLGFLALLKNNKFYFFESNDDQNHELRKPIVRVRRLIITPIKGSCFIGSCNGLICFAGEEHDIHIPVCMCNPFTKEYVNLPEIRIDGDDFDFSTFGFGYLPSTNEYKVVAIHVYKTKFIEVRIYTLGSGSGWRNLGKFSSEFCLMYNLDHEHGSFANGSIYWVNTNLDMILTFDLIEEKFCEHLAPPPFPLYTTIGVLGEFLYISILDEGDDRYDIWLLKLKKKNDNHDKKEGEEHRSLEWSKEFRVKARHALAVTKRGGCFILQYF